MPTKFFSAAALALGGIASAIGGTISTNTYAYADSIGTVQAIVTDTVLDNFNGDTSQWTWIYTVQNLSYDPTYLGRSLGGIKLFFPGESLGSPAYPAQNFNPPFNLDLGDNPGSWSFAGLLPGQSQIFEFTTAPAPIVTKRGELDALDPQFLPTSPLSGSSDVPGSVVPEPATGTLTTASLFVIAACTRMRACLRRLAKAQTSGEHEVC